MSSDGQPVELESQFIMRLPPGPASVLRDALKSGHTNIKDRLKLKMENDLRHGTLFLDDFVLPSKVVDLPCVVESHKSIDKKVVYKTADICQMLLCMEEEEPPEDETKTPKKKDPSKVDKKYIWPHGITPPLKNVRKRRFRKTLKKKQYLDQPEIEKEVRRLLRADYEAHHVSWEVIDEEEDKTKGKDVLPLMQGSKTNEQPSNSRGIAAELFGDALSDSDGEENEDEDLDRGEIDDESRISMTEDPENSRSVLSDSLSLSQQMGLDKKSGYVTAFSKDMFEGSSHSRRSPEKQGKGKHDKHSIRRPSSSDLASMTRGDLQAQLGELKNQLTEISGRRQIQETELATTHNVQLKDRLENVLHKLIIDQTTKEKEIREVEMLMNQMQHD